MNRKKLVVLDIDHTLLHTWMPQALPPFIAPDDPHRTEIARKQFAERLLAEYPGTCTWNDAIICPRPHLAWFIQSLLDHPDIELGIYSTAAPIYIDECLSRAAPALLSHTRFVWGKAHCIKHNDTRMKDLSRVASEFGYLLDDIIMIDDLPVVLPKSNRLAIQPFRVDLNLDLALRDNQLPAIFNQLSKWITHRS